MNDVDYIIKTPGRCKGHRLCHINVPKLYQERENAAGSKHQTVLAVAGITFSLPEQPTDFDLVESTVKGLRLNNSDMLHHLDQTLGLLPEIGQEELKALITEFLAIFPDVLGMTVCTCHDVDVGVVQPIKQHPYRINPIKLEYICKEVEYMLQNKIIKPSQSQWSSLVSWYRNRMEAIGSVLIFAELMLLQKQTLFLFPTLMTVLTELGMLVM